MVVSVLALHIEVVLLMEAIDRIHARLESAPDLPATLAAGWEAFELARVITSAYANGARTRFATFLYAGSAACEGRDAIYTAPSTPRDLTEITVTDELQVLGEDEACDRLADLARTLSRRLRDAAGEAMDPADREACEESAQAADELRRILTGTG
jgi:hypothetical protein